MIIDHQQITYKNEIAFESILANDSHTFNFHLENEACFVHVSKGQHIAFTPSEVMEVPEGNLAFSVGENLILKTIPNQENEYQVTIIRIPRASVLDAYAHSSPELAGTENNFSYDIISGKPCVVTRNYIEGIRHYFNNQHIITPEIIDLKLREILFLLLRSKKAKQVARLLEQFVNRNTAGFKGTIEKHLFNDITLNELAQLCNMSLSTFKRHFKKIYGSSPSEYIFESRLEASKKLLAGSNMTMEEVAMETGFKTTSHFSRKFKEKYGHPPSQFRLLQN